MKNSVFCDFLPNHETFSQQTFVYRNQSCCKVILDVFERIFSVKRCLYVFLSAKHKYFPPTEENICFGYSKIHTKHLFKLKIRSNTSKITLQQLWFQYTKVFWKKSHDLGENRKKRYFSSKITNLKKSVFCNFLLNHETFSKKPLEIEPKVAEKSLCNNFGFDLQRIFGKKSHGWGKIVKIVFFK